jgi:hypothetical protein
VIDEETKLKFEWSHYTEAGTYTGIPIAGSGGAQPSITVSCDADGYFVYHVMILVVTNSKACSVSCFAKPCLQSPHLCCPF